jgi:hypothetical protein
MTDMAATKPVDLVEQDYSRATNHKRRAQHTKARAGVPEQDNLEQDIAESTFSVTKPTLQDSCDISAWVIAESEKMSREVTPTAQFVFATKGKDKMANAARRLSSGLYTTYTVRRDSNAHH